MAAKFDNKMGFIYLHAGDNLDPVLKTMVSCAFDEETDHDELEIKAEMQELDLYTRMCLIKTFLFPYELLLTKIFMGKPWTKEKMKAQRFYWKFLIGKITIKELKDELVKMTMGEA